MELKSTVFSECIICVTAYGYLNPETDINERNLVFTGFQGSYVQTSAHAIDDK